MTSCGGMFSVIVRRSTFTIRSTIGIRMKRPGPFGFGSSRPSRKMIPPSYPRATLVAEIRNGTIRNSRTSTTISAAAIGSRSYLLGHVARQRLDLEHEAGIHARDPHPLAGPERAVGDRLRAPQLAVDEDQVV